jgi:hypothetical protein
MLCNVIIFWGFVLVLGFGKEEEQGHYDDD